MPGKQNQSVGEAGESAAVRLLRDEGYKVLETNYETSLGEIDVIAEEEGVLCFVEVKTRLSQSKGSALDAVNPRKQRQITRVAAAYLARRHPSRRDCRFDVVAVNRSEGEIKLEILRDAFRPEARYTI